MSRMRDIAGRLLGWAARKTPDQVGRLTGFGHRASWLENATGSTRRSIDHLLARERAAGPGHVPLLSSYLHKRRLGRLEALSERAKHDQRGAWMGLGAAVPRTVSRARAAYANATGVGQRQFTPMHMLAAAGVGAGLGMLKSSSAQGGLMAGQSDEYIEISPFHPWVLRKIAAYQQRSAASMATPPAPPKPAVPASAPGPKASIPTGPARAVATLGKKKNHMPPAFEAPSDKRPR